MEKTNKVVRLSYSGGLLGLLAGRSKGKVEAVIKAENAKGWNFCEAIPDQPNLIIHLVRLLILIATLGLWTLSTGYLFIFEKPRTRDGSANKEVSSAGRIEPRLYAEPRSS